MILLECLKFKLVLPMFSLDILVTMIMLFVHLGKITRGGQDTMSCAAPAT